MSFLITVFDLQSVAFDLLLLSFTLYVFIVSDCVIGFNNLEAVFGCPTVTDFILLFFGFSTIFDNLKTLFL